MLDLLIRNDLAVYSSHLPLDAHPRLGNNARLCAALGFKKLQTVFPGKRPPHRLAGADENFARSLGNKVGRGAGTCAAPPARRRRACERIGVVTGGAGSELKLAAQEGVDTFITGEGPHWTFALAEDLGLNVFYGGHYATETFGVKALAADLSNTFRLPWIFLDHPTGL